MALKKISDWLGGPSGEEKETKKQETKTYKIAGTKDGKLELAHEIVVRTEKKKAPFNINKKKLGGHGPGTPLRIIPIGGFEEVGKNSMILEYGDEIILIDCGLQFAEGEMLGIDFVIPDISYLEKKIKNINGILITHGHLDHIGALPHILPKLNYPKIYATKLTNGLSKKLCDEAGITSKCRFIDIDHKETFKLGIFEITPFRVNHSIPDGVGFKVKTPNGSIVHTGDFKFDFSPSDGNPSDYGRIAKMGDEGVVAAFVDSTNSGKEGFAKSEKLVAESLESIIKNADGRIVMALFASLIGRISEIVKFADKYNKKIFLSGRSLVNNIEIAQRLGYIKDPKGVINKLTAEVKKTDPKKTIILCTGSQGEDLSALARISRGEHPLISLHKNDTVVLSSSPIIGNERSVYNLIDQVTSQGCHVVTNSAMDVHTSGHAYQGELMLMYSLLKPKYLVPVHGELHMRIKHREVINQRLGHAEEDMPILYNGSILEIDKNGNAHISDEKLDYNIVMVDGLGVGDIGEQVIKERQAMSENGVLVLLYQADKKTKKLKGKPEVISRGFIAVKNTPEINNELKQRAEKLYSDAIEANKEIELKSLKRIISDGVVRYTDKKIKRIPVVIPIISYS